MFDITSAPQENLENQTFAAWAGMALGGGSLVNGMGYDRGTQPDYNAWEELGNDGWNWDSMLTYFKKVCDCWKTEAGDVTDSEYRAALSLPTLMRMLPSTTTLGIFRHTVAVLFRSLFPNGSTLRCLLSGMPWTR